MADVLWAVINGDEDQILGILARYPEYTFEGIDEVVANAKISMGDDDGKMDLLRVFADHKYDAGFRTDDVALWACYVSWKQGEPMKPLARIEGDSAPYKFPVAAKKRRRHRKKS